MASKKIKSVILKDKSGKEAKYKIGSKAYEKVVGQGGSSSGSGYAGFGAAGRGEFDENQALLDEALEYDAPLSEAGDLGSDPGYKVPKANIPRGPVRLTGEESAGLAKEYGLKGIADDDYSGLTREEARMKASAKKDLLQSQSSALTSYAYNPETISGVGKSVKNMNIGLKDIQYNPWTPGEAKADHINGIVANTTKEIANYFNDPSEFLTATEQNKDIAALMKEFTAAGGATADVVKRISETAKGKALGQSQTVADYLSSNLERQAFGEAETALEPQLVTLADEIERNVSIPESLKSIYYGTKDTIGVLSQEKEIASASIKAAEQKLAREIKNEKERLALTKQKNKAATDQLIAENEENRQNAKTYMTGMLAKLGALQTTGEAPKALATLDFKYQREENKLKQTLKFANQELELDTEDRINDFIAKRDAAIEKISGDLSKSEEDIRKEIFKEQKEADQRIYSAITKYNEDAQNLHEKYRTEARRRAETYADDFFKIASGGLSIADVNAEGRKLSPAKTKAARDLQIATDSAYTYYMTLPKAFRDLWARQSAEFGANQLYGIEDIKAAYKYYQEELGRITPGKEKTASAESSASSASPDDEDLF